MTLPRNATGISSMYSAKFGDSPPMFLELPLEEFRLSNNISLLAGEFFAHERLNKVVPGGNCTFERMLLIAEAIQITRSISKVSASEQEALKNRYLTIDQLLSLACYGGDRKLDLRDGRVYGTTELNLLQKQYAVRTLTQFPSAKCDTCGEDFWVFASAYGKVGVEPPQWSCMLCDNPWIMLWETFEEIGRVSPQIYCDWKSRCEQMARLKHIQTERVRKREELARKKAEREAERDRKWAEREAERDRKWAEREAKREAERERKREERDRKWAEREAKRETELARKRAEEEAEKLARKKLARRARPYLSLRDRDDRAKIDDVLEARSIGLSPTAACPKCAEECFTFESLSPNRKAATWKCGYCDSRLLVRADAVQRKRDNEAGRGPIPKDVQREVWRRDQNRCVECGSQYNLELDHIIPVSLGGANTARNIQLLCQDCNRRKSSRPPGEY